MIASRTVVEGDAEAVVARGFMAVNWGEGEVIEKMISGHEPGHELTTTGTYDAQNGAYGSEG